MPAMMMPIAPARSAVKTSAAAMARPMEYRASGRAFGMVGVTRAIVILAAAIAAMAMMVAALWAWQNAPDMVADWDVLRPGQMVWAIRTAAIATAALAQVVIFGVVAGQIFSRRTSDQAVVIGSAIVFVVAVIAAVILAVGGG
jgi:hypothetical protein